MSDEPTHTEDDRIRPLDVVVSVWVLFVLALAQPLLDLLGRNAEFFLARSAPPLDIILLAVSLTVILPLIVGLLVVGVRRVHEPTGRILHGLVLALLGGLLVLQIIELTALSKASPWIEIAVAFAAGVLLAVAFYRYAAMRSAAKFAAVAPFVILGLFVFASSASQLVFTSSAIAQPAQIAVGDPAPIVMVIFDEFPVASLMDENGELQEDLYPGFAKLANDGTWFSNAVTTQQQTENALPAILTGRNPSPNKIPTAGDHPFTLFTLLADSYELKVIESVTDLCPEYACENTTRPEFSTTERWSTLVSDLRVVAGHLFLPSDWTKDLPSIDASWSNFSGGEAGDFDIIDRFQDATYEDGRITPIAQFNESIKAS
ncbi:MAG: LTA synthase family protein, partial [Actinomycetia bacterium]|nr:LTA synthase family protein [Actinomycetes bacterium]